jgi:heme-degrading monooxygenase HmoA/catechol 2,3-dioxygenase-like lactoylglutathione lyase family enzyme
MLYQVEMRVRRLEATRTFFDAIASLVGFQRRYGDDLFLRYEPVDCGYPRIAFRRSDEPGNASSLILSVESRAAVEQAAAALREAGTDVEGPDLRSYDGSERYALAFSDPDGNRFEIVAEPVASRTPRIARIWRSRVRPGMLRAYRRYIGTTGLADYRDTPGNLGAWILGAQRDGYDDVLTLSFWESRDAIVRFAGEPISRAQYYAEDEKYLLDFPKEVEHFDLN